jgi:hypothetical protein
MEGLDLRVNFLEEFIKFNDLICTIMASLYELPNPLNHLKQDFNPVKVPDFPNRHEKLSQFESFNLVYPRCVENLKHIENLHKSQCEKPRLRAYPLSRVETQNFAESRSPSFKSIHENSLPITKKVPLLPLLSIRTNAIEELYKEIKDLKAGINDLEEKNRINSQCIEVNKLKIANLEENYQKLKQKAGLGLSSEEKKAELVNKLKNYQNDWKKNTAGLNKIVQELEVEVRSWTKKVEIAKDLVCRQGINNRVLKRSIKDCSSLESNSQSCESLNFTERTRVLVHSPSLNIPRN